MKEIRIVSRKTPLDGRLEVSAETVSALESLGEGVEADLGGQRGLARAERMSCTCAKGAGGAHTHHFVVSELFRSLREGDHVEIAVDSTSKSVQVRSAE